MGSQRKYIHFILTTSQLELSLAVSKSHLARSQAQRRKVGGTEAADILDPIIDKSEQVVDLILQSLALHRSRTKLIVTETQFKVICQSISLTRRRVELQLLRKDQANEAKHTLLDYLEELEATLGQANHEPTRFDISSADAFNDTELGTRFGPLMRAPPG